MKKQIFVFCALFVCGSMLCSCYDDKSSLDTRKLPEVLIDVTGAYASGVIRAGYMEDLTVAPKVTKAGREDHPDLSYCWTLTRMPTNIEHDTLSEEQVLNYTIQRAIIPNPYTLWLTVTDNENTMVYQHFWELYVESSFGEGLLVAYTRDGVVSDFALAMDSRISSDYEKPTLVREGLYEVANGAPIPALIKHATYAADAYRTSSYQNVIRATTAKNIYIINCKDYSRMDDEMVYVPDNFAPDKFVKTPQATLFNAGPAGIYAMGPLDKKPVMPFIVHDNGGVADLRVSSDSYNGGDWPSAVWYHDGKFYRFNGTIPSLSYGAFDATSITPAFDPSNLPGQECLAAGLSTDQVTHTFLMKDIATGNHSIYTFAREVNNYPDPNTPAQAKAKIDLPASLNATLNAAVSVFFLDDYAVMFIATPNAITPVIFAGGTVTTGTTYNVPAGETLTIAKLFQQGVFLDARELFDPYMTSTPIAPLPFNNRAIYFATSTGAYEGNVYVVPMITNLVSSGTLDTDVSKTLKFTGFGKILDIVMQGR